MYAYAKAEQKKGIKNTVQKKKAANTQVPGRMTNIRCPHPIPVRSMDVGRPHIAMPGQAVIQRKILVDGIELNPGREMFTEIQEFITRRKIPDVYKTERFLSELKRIAKEPEEHRFADRNELFEAVFQRMQIKSERKVKTENPAVSRARKLFNDIKKDAEVIVSTMTPEDIKQRMISGLEPGTISQEYNSPKGSIAGTVVYTYKNRCCSMKIEIHPKGGIHYGAYLLVELSYGSTTEQWKWVDSKRSTYLPGQEHRTHTFAREGFYDIMEDMQDVSKFVHPQKGVDTPDTILQTPIKKIFRKKGMVESEIWSDETKESVEAYRDKIRISRLKKLNSLRPSPVKAATVGLESAKLTRRLAVLSLEITRMRSVRNVRRCEAIIEECTRIRESMDMLKEMIDSEPDPLERARLNWYVQYNDEECISVERRAKKIVSETGH